MAAGRSRPIAVRRMSILDFLRRRRGPTAHAGPPLLPRLEARLPPDGGPGLLPPEDLEEAAVEKRLGDRWAAELHLLGRGAAPIGASRRLAAIAWAARRRDVDELGEAVDGLAPWDLPDLMEALLARTDVPVKPLAETARGLAARASDYPALAAAVALIAPDVHDSDRMLLFLAGRSPALAGVCALAVEKLPASDAALLDLAAAGAGLSRSLALERLALRHLEDPAPFAPLVPRALALAAAIEDPLERAWAAVPLLEAAKIDERVGAEPELAAPALACLEAVSRGGWNGGPGPGLARLPGAVRTARALIESESIDEGVRRAAALAVVDARPMPTGAVRTSAERHLADVAR